MNKQETLSIRVSKQQRKRYEEEAEYLGMGLSEFIRFTIERYLMIAKQDKPRP